MACLIDGEEEEEKGEHLGRDLALSI